MAEIRFNYGDKFTQTSDSTTGIGSTIPAGKLDVAGNTKAGSLRVTGIATLSSVSGFVNTKLTTSTQDMIVEAGNSGSVSGEVVIGTGQTISVSTGATTGQGGIQSLKVYETFMPPVGGTADRPTDVKPGMVYYNKDFKTIEFWDGNFWKQVDNSTRVDRGIFSGGYAPTTPSITFVNVSTKGDAVAFGNLEVPIMFGGGCSTGTRGVFGGGRGPAPSYTKYNVIQYLTIASSGNTHDFGDLTHARRRVDSTSSSTRGLWGSADGTPSTVNIIDYVELNTLGNALDFGDMTDDAYSRGALSSPTRAVWFGGGNSDPIIHNMEFVTIASKGNGVIFGDMTEARSNCAGGGFSNGVSGVIAGGYGRSADSYPLSKNIDKITIASEGNAIDFGTLSFVTRDYNGAQNIVRGLIAGGSNPSTYQNVISAISLHTSGFSEDFGDLMEPAKALVGLSGSHGGLGGF